ncbi:16616_t:CDS:2, partial [Acaulospora morrowiae]
MVDRTNKKGQALQQANHLRWPKSQLHTWVFWVLSIRVLHSIDRVSKETKNLRKYLTTNELEESAQE